jgi:hypothetical protein
VGLKNRKEFEGRLGHVAVLFRRGKGLFTERILGDTVTRRLLEFEFLPLADLVVFADEVNIAGTKENADKYNDPITCNLTRDEHHILKLMGAVPELNGTLYGEGLIAEVNKKAEALSCNPSRPLPPAPQPIKPPGRS